MCLSIRIQHLGQPAPLLDPAVAQVQACQDQGDHVVNPPMRHHHGRHDQPVFKAVPATNHTHSGSLGKALQRRFVSYQNQPGHEAAGAWCQLQSLRADRHKLGKGSSYKPSRQALEGQKNPNRQKIAKKATYQRKRRYSPMKQFFSLLGCAQPEKNCFFSGFSSTSGR